MRMSGENTGRIQPFKACPAEDLPDSLADIVLNEDASLLRREHETSKTGCDAGGEINLNRDGFFLLEIAKGGDETERKILYHKLKRLYEPFAFRGGVGGEYEDIFHTAFMRLWGARIKNHDSFPAFFEKIIRNLIISEYRRRGKCNQVGIADDNDRKEYQHEDISLFVHENKLPNDYTSQKGESLYPNPVRDILREEGRITILEAVESLKPEFRDVIRMHYYESRKLEEIADLIDVPLGTVKSRMFYAKRMLNGILREYFDN